MIIIVNLYIYPPTIKYTVQNLRKVNINDLVPDKIEYIHLKPIDKSSLLMISLLRAIHRIRIPNL